MFNFRTPGVPFRKVVGQLAFAGSQLPLSRMLPASLSLSNTHLFSLLFFFFFEDTQEVMPIFALSRQIKTEYKPNSAVAYHPPHLTNTLQRHITGTQWQPGFRHTKELEQPVNGCCSCPLPVPTDFFSRVQTILSLLQCSLGGIDKAICLQPEIRTGLACRIIEVQVFGDHLRITIQHPAIQHLISTLFPVDNNNLYILATEKKGCVHKSSHMLPS